MRKIILPLIAVVVFAGCSAATSNDTEKALACNQLYESRASMNPERYNLESYLQWGDAINNSQVWYDDKYGSCVFAIKIDSSYMQITPEEKRVFFHRKEYWDLESDSLIWSFTNEFDIDLVDTENNFFSNNKF